MSHDHCNEDNIDDMLSFVFQSPCDCDEQIIEMDCNDYCEQLAHLAERVAAGEKIADLMPRLREHMQHWPDCREEFEALVAILRAEESGELAAIVEDLIESAPASGDISPGSE